MKAQIQISGQINGNFTLLNKLNTIHGYKKTMFNGFLIEYKTIGEAKKAIREAYKVLKRECKEDNIKLPSISKSNDYLSYDASTAQLIAN